MNNRIERKIPLFLRTYFTLMLVSIIVVAVKEVNNYLLYGTTDFDAADFILFIFWGMPNITIIIWFLTKTATRIILEDKIMKVNLVFKKNIEIPLENISKIEICGNEELNRHFYIIRYGDKKIYSLLVSFGVGPSFDRFIDELQDRIDNAKRETEDSQNHMNQ